MNFKKRLLRTIILQLTISILFFECSLALNSRQEVTNDRTRYAKTYDNGDGTRTIEIDSIPIHYKDSEGNWQEISNQSLQYAVSNSAMFSETNNPFPKDAASPWRFSEGEAWIEFQPQGVEPVVGQAAANSVTYPSAWPQTDLRYTVEEERVKEEIILHHSNAPRRFAFSIKGQEVSLKEELDGSIGVYAKNSGDKLWSLPPSFAYDSKENQAPEEALIPLEQTLYKNGEDYRLEISVPEYWFFAPERTFPVIIDPTVVKTLNEYDSFTFVPPFPQTIEYSWYLKGAPGWPRYNASEFQIRYDGSGGPIIASDHEWKGPRTGSGSFYTEGNRTIYANVRRGDAQEWLHIAYGVARLTITYNTGSPPIANAEFPLASDGLIGSNIVLKWRYQDQDGQAQNQYRIQLSPDPVFPVFGFPVFNVREYRGIMNVEAGGQASFTPPGQLPDGKWYWRVMVSDQTTNFWSQWSNTGSFTIDSSPPVAILAAAIAKRRSLGEIQITWPAAVDKLSGVKLYELELKQGGEWTRFKQIEHIDGKTNFEATVSDLAPNQLIWLRLRSVDRAGNISEWTEFSCATLAASTTFAVSITGNLSEGYRGSLDVVPVEASGYQFKRINLADGQVKESPWLEATSYVDDGLASHGTYQYQVRTRNIEELATEYGPVLQVSVPNNRPNCPELLLPVNGSVTNQRKVNLQVQAASDPDGDVVLYRFEVTAVLNNGEPDFSEGILVYTSEWTSDLTMQTPDLPDGSYYWRVRAKDDLPLGSLETEILDLYANFQIYTKGLAGTFKILEGLATAKRELTLTELTVNSMDGISPDKVRFRNEDPKTGTYDNWVEFTYGVGSIPWELLAGDGAKVISMQVLDNTGTWGGSYQQTILLDTTPPMLAKFFQTSGRSGAVAISWSPALDETTKIGSYDLEFLKSGDMWQALVTKSSLLTATIANLADNETVQFRLRARDIVGNISGWSEPFQGCSLAAVSSIVRTTTGVDSQGHFLEFELLPVLASAYKIKVTSDSGGATNSDWLTSTVPPGEASTGIIYRDYGLQPHATYGYRVLTRNALGEETQGQEQLITLANLPPSGAELISPLSWLASSQVELRHALAEDVDGDLLTYAYKVQDQLGNEFYKGTDPELINLVDGMTYQWFVEVSDGTSLVQSGPGIFTIDLTAPTIALSDTASAWVERKSITVRAQDSTSGVAELSYRWDHNPYLPLANDSALNVPHGIQTLWVRAIDWAGNVQEKSTLYRVDATSPVITELEVQGKLLTPFPGGPSVRLGTGDRQGLFARWRAVDPESGLKQYRIGVFAQGEEPQEERCITSNTLNPEGSYLQFVTSSLEDGKVYQVAVQAENQVGTWSEFVLSEPVFVDGSPPEVRIDEITGGVKAQNAIYLTDFGKLELSSTTLDPHSGIVGIAYAISEQPKVTGKEKWRATIPQLASEVKVGVPFYLLMQATNAVGLKSVCFSPALIIDNTPPQIVDFSDEGEVAASSRRLVFNVTVAEPESALAEVQYCLGTAPGSNDLSINLPGSVAGWFQLEAPLAGVTREFAIGGLEFLTGEYFATVRATNVVGLSSQLATDGIFVDLSQPARPVVIDDGLYSPDKESFHAWWHLTRKPSGKLEAYDYHLLDSEGKEVFPWRTIEVDNHELPVEINEHSLTLIDGRKYYLEVKARYEDGSESPLGVSDGIIIDSTPPENIIIHHARYSPAELLEFTWQAEDKISGLRKASYAIGTTRGGSEITGGFLPLELARKKVACFELDLLEGNIYYVTISVLNGAGMEKRVSSDGFIVDSPPPPPPKVVDQGLYTNDNTQLSANWLWTASDPESETIAYAYALLEKRDVDAATVWHDIGLETKVTVDNLALPDGSVCYFAVRATNGAGLVSIGFSDGIIVDTSAPGLPRIDDFVDYITSVPATLRALIYGFDYESGIESYEYCLGTEAEPAKLVPPTVIETGADSVLVELPGLALIDGTRYYFTVNAKNNAGLISASSISDGIMVDLGFPKITSVQVEGEYTRKKTELACFWTATPSASKIIGYQYAIVTDPNQLGEINWVDNGLDRLLVAKDLELEDGKTYYFLVRAQNAAGTWTPNSQIGKSAGIVVDASSPPVPEVFVNNLYTAGDLFFTWSGEDPHSGIASWQYAIGIVRGGAELTGWVTVTEKNKRTMALTDLPVVHGENYFITVRSQNRAGAWSDFGYSKLIIGDCTPPTTPLVTAPGAYLTDKERIVGARWQSEDPQSGIAAWRYALAQETTGVPLFGEARSSQRAELTWNLENLDLQEGETYYLAVQTQNSLGNWSAIGWSSAMLVDTIPPRIMPEAPEFVANAETVAIPWEITEAAKVTITCQRPDGSKSEETYNVDPGQHFYEANCPLVGLYEICFVPVDLAGNTGEQVLVSLRKNALPEIMPLFDRQVRKGEPFSLLASAHDPDGEIVSFFWDLGNGAEKAGERLDDFSYPEVGVYTVTLIVTDNDAASSSLSFKITVSNTSAGTLYLNETWSGAHQLTGDVMVPVGVKLTILSGTQIQASAGVSLRVLGELLAEGQELTPIIFAKAGLEAWRGIILERCENAEFSWVQVSGARAGLAIIQSQAKLRESKFEKNELGLHLYNSAPLVENCSFFENALYGIKEDQGAKPIVRNCLFHQNAVGDYYHLLKTIIAADELNSLGENSGNKAGRDF